MKSLADYLPPEFAAFVHPDWRKNEADYWAVRDQLLQQYQNQWIGFADGRVIASGRSAVEVLHAAKKAALHPFMTCVGREEEPDRIRRVVFPYDTMQSPEPLPLMDAEFRLDPAVAGIRFDRIIPDTGSDASVLPWSDCKLLKLDPSVGVPGVIAGVGGGVQGTYVFDVWIQLDGKAYKCRLHADIKSAERILGRDVLNKLEILFRGPANEVVVNP